MLFLGQTPVMSHLPWLWIYYSLNVVNLWGGVGNAYLADIMPPEWRSVAFGLNSSICTCSNSLHRLLRKSEMKNGRHCCTQTASGRYSGRRST